MNASTEWEDTAWTVNVKTASGSILRTATGSGMAISYTWDGKNGQGIVETDGVYTLEVLTSVGTASASASGISTLDATRPTVSLSSPLSSDVLSNVNSNGATSFPARGSVSDANLVNWILDAKRTGSTWASIASGTSNVNDGVLGTWATGTLLSGLYEVRLQANDLAGNLITVINTPFMGHFKVSQPTFQLNAATNESITYTSEVPFELTETIVLKNSAGQTVRTLVNGTRAAGTFSDVWNGRNDAGIVVPDGAYTYIATATTPTHSFAWDLSSEMRAANTTFVPSTASNPVDSYNNQPVRLTYTLTEPSRIMIGAMLADHSFNVQNVACNPRPANTTCILQDFKPAGTHTYTWAGTNENGISVSGQNFLVVVKRNDLFSKNMVLVFGNAPSINNPRFSPVYYGMGTGPQTLSFDLGGGSGPMTITIHYLNQSSGSLINTIQMTNQIAGPIAVVWNGQAGNGSPASPGRHTVFITATDSLGNAITQSAVMTIAY